MKCLIICGLQKTAVEMDVILDHLASLFKLLMENQFVLVPAKKHISNSMETKVINHFFIQKIISIHLV